MKNNRQSESDLYETFGLSSRPHAKKAMLNLLKNLADGEQPSRMTLIFCYIFEFSIDLAVSFGIGILFRSGFDLSKLELAIVFSAVLVSLTIARTGMLLLKNYIENSANQINTLKSIAIAVWAVHGEEDENADAQQASAGNP